MKFIGFIQKGKTPSEPTGLLETESQVSKMPRVPPHYLVEC